MGRGDHVVAALAVALAVTAPLSGCARDPGSPGVDADLDAPPPWDVAQPEPEPRPGMVWIPPGVLIAGTPPDRLPRVADEEMAGAQVVMRGFYIDVFPYPNEVGAIPTSGVTLDEARALCEAQGKRLCTELEFERACKGPSNTVYEYGDTYRAATCGTGQGRALTPNGVNATCVSAFGVHDLHGGVWTWTASQWQRNSAKPGLFTLRGGNSPGPRPTDRPGAAGSPPGELIGRCANGRGLRPDARRPEVGVRCCAGEVNSFEVVLEVSRGRPLRFLQNEERLAQQLQRVVPDEVRDAVRGLRPEDQFKVERVWVWHPLGNEELLIGGGCAHPRGAKAMCGLVIARVRSDTATPLSFVSADWWQPTLSETDTPRELFLYGGDIGGAFRRRVSYEWGRIAAGAKERRRKHKGRRGLSFD